MGPCLCLCFNQWLFRPCEHDPQLEQDIPIVLFTQLQREVLRVM